MIIRKFNEYKLNENEESRKSLSYYSFDWDDNILHMGTVIHMIRKKVKTGHQ